MGKERDISDIDLFAERVQLRFNGNTHFKTVCGGLISVLFLIHLGFCFAMMFKALITGQYINAAVTTQDMQLTDEGLQLNVTLSDMGMRFGFMGAPNL